MGVVVKFEGEEGTTVGPGSHDQARDSPPSLIAGERG